MVVIFNGTEYDSVTNLDDGYTETIDKEGDILFFDKDGNECCACCGDGPYLCHYDHCNEYHCDNCSTEMCHDCNVYSCVPDEGYCLCWTRCYSCEDIFDSQEENPCIICNEQRCTKCLHCNECGDKK
jgi:hypothetical protein